MSKLRPGKIIRVINGRWYPNNKIETHICCNCGSAHRVYFKIKDGQLYSKWVAIEPREKDK